MPHPIDDRQEDGRGATLIIAEAGVNHNGVLDNAIKLVDLAAEAGADAIKFQTFQAELVVSVHTPLAEYQVKSVPQGASQLDLIRKLELSRDDHRRIFQRCKQKMIHFFSSPFDIESIDFLDELGVDTYKIPSGEIVNLPYLRKIGEKQKDIIMSSGMADLGEIGDALNILVSSGMAMNRITVLHCNTSYPTPFEDANLRAMLAIKASFPGISIGYSDHTLGIEAAVAAVALGACVIEKHITLDKNMDGPDHAASLDPLEFGRMVCAIRNVEKAMGSGIKKPTSSESINKMAVRKSIVASRAILKGEKFTEENMCVKRPGSGISPMKWDEVLGQTAEEDYNRDDLI